MADRSLSNAWANVLGRRVASVTTIVIVASLMAAVVALLIPLRDVRDNQRAMYDDPQWHFVFLVDGVVGASQPMSGTDIEKLRRTPGVTEVSAFDVVDADSPSGLVQVRNYVPALGIRLVQGRAPAEGSCEAVVTRDVPGARLQESLAVALPSGGASAASQLDPVVVGVVDRGYPLLSGPTLLTTCPLPQSDSPSQLVVSTSDGRLPPTYAAQSLDSAARSAMDGQGSTGIIGLIALLVAVMALVVVGSLSRWSVRTRVGEFATLRVWGRSKSDVLSMVSAEQGVLLLIAAPLGIGLGTWLAWTLVRSGGPASLVDPDAAIAVAVPSLSTVAMAVGGFGLAMLALTLLPVWRSIAPDVARLLRRRGE
ncbi:MAG TPA: ABC transporter permease [Humibacillus sp.]|nr:ABC transporter permease [Humibacillus sp.]